MVDAAKALQSAAKAINSVAEYVPAKRVVFPTFNIPTPPTPMPIHKLRGMGKSNNLYMNNNFTFSQRGGGSVINYIKREEVTVNIVRLNKKYKGKYRYKAKADATVYTDNTATGEKVFHLWSDLSGNSNTTMESSTVYSKTKHGAEVSAITSLLHKCRPPLSKKAKAKNYERQVYTEVRVSNTFDFMMNDDDKNKNWHEIRIKKEQSP